MDYPNFYQIVLDSGKAYSFDATTKKAEFVIKPDPRAPVIDEDWRGGSHAAYLVEVEGAAGKGTLGIVSPDFRGGSHNLDDEVALVSDACTSAGVAASYTIINDHSFFNLDNPYLFRNGGRLSLRLVHLDRDVADVDYDVPTTVAKFVVILRFERIRGFEKCTCHHK